MADIRSPFKDLPVGEKKTKTFDLTKYLATGVTVATITSILYDNPGVTTDISSGTGTQLVNFRMLFPTLVPGDTFDADLLFMDSAGEIGTASMTFRVIAVHG